MPSRGALRYDPDTGLYCLGEEPFTGVSNTRHRTGKLRSLTQLRGGVACGVSVGWHGSGRINLYSEMDDDVYHGWHMEWDERGTKQVEQHYTNGVRDDPRRGG
jgi:antitoxin component YwqK of YwqJK toxin-antitoxin module